MATRKISFYHSERDTFVEINVSAQDALRAQNDITFATELMNEALQEKDRQAGIINVDEEKTTLQSPCFINCNATSIHTDPEGGSLYKWSSSAVFLLLRTYRSREDKFKSGKTLQKKIWEEVSAVLNNEGHGFTGPQCAAKMRSLKKSYKSIKDHNSKSGNDKRTWQFYEVMDIIFGKKASSSPVAIASSSAVSVSQDGSDSGVALEQSSRLSISLKIASLLGKRIRQKQQHEKAMEKRHREKMAMDAKLLAVLEKFTGNK